MDYQQQQRTGTTVPQKPGLQQQQYGTAPGATTEEVIIQELETPLMTKIYQPTVSRIPSTQPLQTGLTTGLQQPTTQTGFQQTTGFQQPTTQTGLQQPTTGIQPSQTGFQPGIQQQQYKTTGISTTQTGFQQPTVGFQQPTQFQPTTQLGLGTGVQQENLDTIVTISAADEDYIWGLSGRGELFRLVQTARLAMEWQFVPTNGIVLKDLSAVKRGLVFGIGLNDGYLYSLNENIFSIVIPHDRTRLKQVAAQTKRKIYAIDEQNNVIFLKFKMLSKSTLWERTGTVKMKKISVGSKLLTRRAELWGIGLDNRAYKYDGTLWVPFNVRLADLSVAKDNIVYGIRLEDGALLKWEGGDTFFLAQSRMRNAPMFNLSSITAVKRGTMVYGLEKGTGHIVMINF